MNKFSSSIRPWLAVFLAGTLVACGGGAGKDEILGFDTPLSPPTVTAAAPANNATGVPINNTLITAAFSEPMAPITGTATFTLTCAAPCISPTGTVALDSTGRVATLTLAPGTTLAASTVYTATVTGARSLATGLAMTAPFVWHFSTGVLTDTTRPSVAFTVPATSSPGPTAGVATNSAISAVFTEDMAPASISGSTFTLTCAAPCAAPASSISYVVGNRTAQLTPAVALAASTTYVATITTGATDLAGNALAGNQAALPAASNYIWSFTTAAAAAVPPGTVPVPPVSAANITVQSTNPTANANNVCTNATVNATFNVPSGLRMDPNSITSSIFTVAGAAPVTASSVVLDAGTGRIATFTPLAPLTAGVSYTATIRGGASGVKDLAIPANTMAANSSWSFTAISCAAPPPVQASIALGSASLFGTFGGTAGVTNQGLQTVINGNIGTTAVSTAVTGFHDAGPGCTYTETPLNVGTVNGLIYTAPPPPTIVCTSEGTATTFAVATQARADAQAAYNALVAMPGGPDPGAGNLANKTLAPGVYTSAAGTFKIEGGNLTLDAQGNANAVWVFQMASSLTVGGPGGAFPSSIILANGAQAKNVFWQVGSAATVNAGGGGTMAGTVISQSGAAISTAGNATVVTINGRVLSLGASVTMVNTVINVPAP
jgi:hypothetical protein